MLDNCVTVHFWQSRHHTSLPSGDWHSKAAQCSDDEHACCSWVAFCVRSLWGGSKGVINFPWIIDAIQSLVPVGTSGIYPGTHSLGLFAGLFSDAMSYCLPIVSCEMTRTKWLVLKDHIGSTQEDGVPGLLSFNRFNYHSIHTSPTVDWYVLQLTFHEIWH